MTMNLAAGPCELCHAAIKTDRAQLIRRHSRLMRRGAAEPWRGKGSAFAVVCVLVGLVVSFRQTTLL